MLKGASRPLAAAVLTVGSAVAGHTQPAVPPVTPVELNVNQRRCLLIKCPVHIVE